MDFTAVKDSQHAQDLVDAAAAPDSEFTVAALIGCMLEPGQDPGQVERLFEETFAPLFALQGFEDQDDGGERIDTILNHFTNEGFSGPRGSVDFRHSNLVRVMSDKQGIPITMAILLLECGRRCGLSGFGVNFPGHFLLSLAGQLIDPVALTVLDPAAADKIKGKAGHLEPASALMIALRMLNNIKALYLQTQEINQALGVVDIQLAVSAGHEDLLASLYFERGEYWQNLGAVTSAREAFEQCIRLGSFADLTDKAEGRLAQLKGSAETWH